MLKRSVPPFVAEMVEIAQLFVAEQPELDKMEADLTELLLSLIPICRCRRYSLCRCRWAPFH